MEKLKGAWRRTPRTIRQTVVLMVGSTVLLAGLAMTILPGPGWATLFLGLAILGTEFAFAARLRDWIVGKMKRILAHGKRTWLKLMRCTDQDAD